MIKKKIKNMPQLQMEKQQIKMQQQLLLEKMRNTWLNLKENIRPANIAKESFNSIINKPASERPYSENILKKSFTYGATLLAERVADNVIIKMKKIFKSKEK
jgi:hypothetical protein